MNTYWDLKKYVQNGLVLCGFVLVAIFAIMVMSFTLQLAKIHYPLALNGKLNYCGINFMMQSYTIGSSLIGIYHVYEHSNMSLRLLFLTVLPLMVVHTVYFIYTNFVWSKQIQPFQDKYKQLWANNNIEAINELQYAIGCCGGKSAGEFKPEPPKSCEGHLSDPCFTVVSSKENKVKWCVNVEAFVWLAITIFMVYSYYKRAK